MLVTFAPPSVGRLVRAPGSKVLIYLKRFGAGVCGALTANAPTTAACRDLALARGDGDTGAGLILRPRRCLAAQ